MKLHNSPHLDALCSAYVLGTLRGRARRRFEAMLAEQPLIAQRLSYWQQTMTPDFSAAIQVQPSAQVWKKISKSLRLQDHAQAQAQGWWQRLGLWQAWAGASTVAAGVLALALILQAPDTPPVYQTIAELKASDASPARLQAALTPDRSKLKLVPSRPIVASAQQSYELWLLPADGSAPISMAVLGDLTASVDLKPEQANRMAFGAKLAISVEPAGGSPTGLPTGPVILVGEIRG